MVTRRRAIGGTGLAGGIFEGIMASEDIKNRRSQEDRMLALTQSRIESDIVDRQAKALKMEIDQETFNAVKDKRAKEKEINDYIAQNAFIDDVVQTTSPTGGFVNKPIKRMRDFTMEEWLPFHQNIIGLTLSKGLLKPEQIDGALKSVEEMQKKVGLTKFNRLIRNLDSDEAKQLILKEFGVENYTGAKYVVDEATPYIQFNDGQQQRRLDLSTYLQTLGIYDRVMQPLTTQLTLQEKAVGIKTTQSQGRKYESEADEADAMSKLISGKQDPKRLEYERKLDKDEAEIIKVMEDGLGKYASAKPRTDYKPRDYVRTMNLIYDNDKTRKEFGVESKNKRVRGGSGTTYNNIINNYGSNLRNITSPIVQQIITTSRADFLGDKKKRFSAESVAKQIERYLMNPESLKQTVNNLKTRKQIFFYDGFGDAVIDFGQFHMTNQTYKEILNRSIESELEKEFGVRQ